MLTRLRVKNFKRLDMDVELGRSVVFVGPNNSGKTTALQALTLWELGLRQWLAKRGDKAPPKKRLGVAINRRDLLSVPVPGAKLLWRDLHIRGVKRDKGASVGTRNIRIEITVEGIQEEVPWSCGFEFDYQNEESLICRPIRQTGFENAPVEKAKFSAVPQPATEVRAAYLPPMSGLAASEPKWELGRINVLLGEGQTAQVLRNLCFQIYTESGEATWNELCDRVESLFRVKLLPPVHLTERGEITMEYQESSGVRLDLSASGRGLQQTLLLLAHLYANPKTVLLLDEPDAHLEVLRQGSQVIATSHSEVVLEEAATRGEVIAFLGKPHPLRDRGSQLLKALTEIGIDQYYQAEQTGWVLYVEGPTDLAILRGFAALLDHPAAMFLERPFVKYVNTNLPRKARDHFYGLQAAKNDLVGIAIFDRIETELQTTGALTELMWSRREIENFLCIADVLMAYARQPEPGGLLVSPHEEAMRQSIQKISGALEDLGKPGPWSPDIKASDDFLAPLFADFSKRLGLPLVLRKSDYSDLVRHVPREAVDPEIEKKLDAIVAAATKAKPTKS
ncbi:MAG: AAA family ATPase [Planctomycetota bacterium]|nr:AAA family ATPase [Planctomycetota bacterium]